MHEIDVRARPEGDDPLTFDVTVSDGSGAGDYAVRLSAGDYERLARASEPPDAFVRRCFEFLLEREPKESILSSFDVSIIGRYFPEFEEEIAR